MSSLNWYSNTALSCRVNCHYKLPYETWQIKALQWEVFFTDFRRFSTSNGKRNKDRLENYSYVLHKFRLEFSSFFLSIQFLTFTMVLFMVNLLYIQYPLPRHLIKDDAIVRCILFTSKTPLYAERV